MITEIGHFALVLALVVAAMQTVLPAIGAAKRDARLMSVAEPAAMAQLLLLILAFAALTHAYVVSDFSVENVAANSHSTKPLIYKISGVWGNHEGSMLLWVLILAIFGAAVAAFGNNLPATLKANVLAVQASIALAFLLFLVMTSDPFLRLDPAPADGRGLNPILQDPALAFHPPFLYIGYVGFSIAFSFAIAALIEGRIDAAWARWVRPWTLAAWMFLTIGIAMGSWWAYYELGWGGWWFWDPVENASFMPWLAGTALLHSALVMEKREGAQGLDRPACDPDLLAVADGHLHRALGRADLGALVRRRSGPRRLHSRHPDAVHRRRASPVRLARQRTAPGRGVRTGEPRGQPRAEQHASCDGDRHGVCRHALPARARRPDR